ncbi:periphilin-1 isoform X7 [Homo sapiens]|uniref:periphilin-1 isoform X7 n=1 Tax=Homo sapiens TaxID=9606 RepID=UPI001FB156F6|nr:periphilin-1 isoform X7 [Homo sapiens]
MAYRRDEMWSEGRYEYERIPRERAPPRSHPSDGYNRLVNIVPKKPPLLDRPGEGSYNRYYSHVDYRDYDEGRSFSHDRRSGPPHRGDESGYRWTRDDHSASRQPEYRDMRDGFRRKSFYSSHYARERSPYKRDNTFFRESPVGRKDSPHSRSGSSVSSRSYSPERSKSYSFHQSQHRNKERPVQSLKTSRDTSPSSGSAVSSSKVLDKPSRLTEKELAEAASKWAAEKLEKSDESNLPEISEYEAGSTAPLFTDQPEEPESNTTHGIELFEDSQLTTRSKAIASKTKEIEQVYRQDCETFGMVVKMLIEKDPSLEKSIQFALRQNLHEIESAGQTWQQVPPVRNTEMDHDGTPENEGEETAQSHDASNHTIVGLGPNQVPEMKETTLQAPQPPQAPQPLQPRKKRVRRTTQLRRTTGAPDITWGMLKKTTQEAERILLRTQTPFTPENLFLAMLSVVHCNSRKVLVLFILSLCLLPVPTIPY